MSRKPSPSARATAADDLTRIKGIGPAIERRLEAAGLRRFAQLADLAPADITALVAGLSTHRIVKENWIGQARKLAGRRPAAPGRQRYSTFTVELLLDERQRVRRTRAAHVQDGVEAAWQGWAEAPLLEFMAAHAHLNRPVVRLIPQTAPAERRPAEAQPGDDGHALPGELSEAQRPPAGRATRDTQPTSSLAMPVDQTITVAPSEPEVVITELRLIDAAPGLDANSPSLVRRMCAQVDFRLSEALAGRATRCCAQVLAREVATGRASLLAWGQRGLIANSPTGTLTLEFSLPEVGRYQLVGLLQVLETEVVAVAVGPVLKIVP